VAETDAPKKGEPDKVSDKQKQEVRQALEGSAEVSNLPFFAQDVREREQDIVLKRVYAFGLLGLLAVQILVIDGALSMYAWKGVAWKIEPLIIDIWIGATVVEVIAVVLVVTHHLFPSRAAK
jgi:hypothetical protein